MSTLPKAVYRFSAIPIKIQWCPGQVAQLVGTSPTHQKSVGPIPGRGAYEMQLIDISLSLSVFLSLILSIFKNSIDPQK